MDNESRETTTAGTSTTYLPTGHKPAFQHVAEERTTQNVQINGGSFTSAGRDVHNHTHIYEAPKVDIMSVLKAVDNYRQVQQDTLSKATPTTGQWMFEHEFFPSWQNPKGTIKTMWGSGIPGAGKTVLTSIMISGVEKWAEGQTSSICIAYIYIRYSDNAGLTVRHCLEVLVKQTIEKHPSCSKLAEGVYAKHIHLKTRPTEEELLQLLKDFTAMVAATFYFLDALDEAPVPIQYDLVKKLSSLHVKIFITSRPMKALTARFPDFYCFPIAAQERDIELHIKLVIDRSYDLYRILEEDDPSLRANIVSSVKKNCGGMFLHASLQMAALQECTNVHDVKETLANFPTQIEDVYLDTWRRINDQPPSKRLQAQYSLLWVLNAARSMEADELRYAVAIIPQTFKLDSNRLVSLDALVSSCRGLLVVDERTRLVRLVHYTAKSTLEHLILKIFPHPHSLLASVCVIRLADHGFQDWRFGDSARFLSDTLDSEPFLAYAYQLWPIHARSSLYVIDTSTTTHLEQFVRGCKAFPAWHGPFSFELLGPLHIVACFDLPIALAGFDCTSAQDPNGMTRLGETPLHIACRQNALTTMCELLLLEHITVNRTNGRGETPLMLASKTGNEAAVKLLLAHPEIDVNLVDGWYEEPVLTSAARLGATGIVELLLGHPRLNLNVVNKQGHTPLIWALKWDYTVTVNLLLAHPQIDVNLADKETQTPLIWAAREGSTANLKSLLAHPQVDANLADAYGRTPLLWALRENQAGKVDLLLAHPRVNVNLPDQEGRTPLFWALHENQAGKVDLLLAHPRVNVNLPDREGRTPLLWAVNNSLWKSLPSPTFQTILAHPLVDVNAADCQGRTALTLALGMGHMPSILLLLGHPNINPNLADANGQTPLQWAKKRRNAQAVDRILNHPKFVPDIDANSYTPSSSSYGSLPQGVAQTPSTTALRQHPLSAPTYSQPSSTSHPTPPQLPHIDKQPGFLSVPLHQAHLYDLQRDQAHPRQRESTPTSGRAAEKRPVHDCDNDAYAKSSRRRIG